MQIREPHVAGTFYPAVATEIQRFCEPHFKSPGPLRKAKAVLLPHAGYIYSGATACRVLSQIQVPDLNILIGPDHHGAGPDFSLYAEGAWSTPLGMSEVDKPIADCVALKVPSLEKSVSAHSFEHSLEVILPMLQLKNSKARIVPILAATMDLDLAQDTAGALAACIKAEARDSLVVISSDMNHYESDQATRVKDRYALDAISALDAEGLIKQVKKHRISMCGVIPAYMLLIMARDLGIQKATLVDYRTSADATGEKDRVVGYAGFIFE